MWALNDLTRDLGIRAQWGGGQFLRIEDSLLIWTNKISSGGIISWRFIAMFALNQLSFKTKYQLEFDEGHVDEDTYITNLLSVSILGIILSFISLRRVTGSLRAVLHCGSSFHPFFSCPCLDSSLLVQPPKVRHCMEPISRRN